MEYLLIKLLPYICLAFAMGLVVGWFACVHED